MKTTPLILQSPPQPIKRKKQKPIKREPVLTTLSLGGGVQSSTIAEMIVEREIPRPDLVVFADTGNEPTYVYKQIDHLRKRLALIDLTIQIVKTRKGLMDDLYHNGRFTTLPLFTISKKGVARLKRQCTSEYKIKPIESLIKNTLLTMGKAILSTNKKIYINRDALVKTMIGFTKDEAERIKPSRAAWQRFVYPLIDRNMNRNDCIQWLNSKNLPIPEKSACIVCPYHNDQYWKRLKERYPRHFKKAANFDRDLRNGNLMLTENTKAPLYIHRSLIPLNEIDLRDETEHGQMTFAFDLCDEGYCFT